METAPSYNPANSPFRQSWVNYIHRLQEEICAALEKEDGKARFIKDNWDRPAGGGGSTRVISNGAIFEKAGVNTSVVHGAVSQQMQQQLQSEGAASWFAAGLSLVLHPFNPYVPTVHANWRYFELYDAAGNVTDRWFGGGTDLTPYYLFEEDAQHFHRTIKNTMDKFDEKLYPVYKKRCDDYFVNSHRNNETRGIGGAFYDHLRPENDEHAEQLLKFQEANGNAFLAGYLPIVEKRKDVAFGARQKHWQEIRRGRYVEFNLLHDRGTIFGLKTNGRTESILMSLPPTVRFEYDYQPAAGSAEAQLLNVCLEPKDWIN
ncbi:MAG: oxygen-dependent coproporphyrinogen oxidase [Chitinophagaceae bacterium]